MLCSKFRIISGRSFRGEDLKKIDQSEKWIAYGGPSSLAKGYDPLYSSSPLTSLDGCLRSHGDNLYIMQLVVAVTNQKALYTSRLRANKDIFSVYNSRYIFALIVCHWVYIKFSQIFAWKSAIL
jgi:hypothetical protein